MAWCRSSQSSPRGRYQVLWGRVPNVETTTAGCGSCSARVTGQLGAPSGPCKIGLGGGKQKRSGISDDTLIIDSKRRGVCFLNPTLAPKRREARRPRAPKRMQLAGRVSKRPLKETWVVSQTVLDYSAATFYCEGFRLDSVLLESCLKIGFEFPFGFTL